MCKDRSQKANSSYISSPQAYYETIDIEYIKHRAGHINNIVELFITVDQVISLLPNCTLSRFKSLVDSGSINDVYDMFIHWLEYIANSIRHVDFNYLRCEDDIKNTIHAYTSFR